MHAQVHIIVEGLVQGVGFRWFVQRQAESLRLGGHVRNLYDGRVEILASGDQGLLQELARAVRVGPRGAHVTDVKIDWLPPPAEAVKGESPSFEIR
jgi:acylphosphatase